jgi:hypothetical protein
MLITKETESLVGGGGGLISGGGLSHVVGCNLSRTGSEWRPNKLRNDPLNGVIKDKEMRGARLTRDIY